jgi:hypothetical protein
MNGTRPMLRLSIEVAYGRLTFLAQRKEHVP